MFKELPYAEKHTRSNANYVTLFLEKRQVGGIFKSKVFIKINTVFPVLSNFNEIYQTMLILSSLS